MMKLYLIGVLEKIDRTSLFVTSVLCSVCVCAHARVRVCMCVCVCVVGGGD